MTLNPKPLELDLLHELKPTNTNKLPLVPELQSSHGSGALVLPSEVLSAAATTQLCRGRGAEE